MMVQATPKTQGFGDQLTVDPARWYAVQIDYASKVLLVELLTQEEQRLTVAARENHWEVQDRAIADLVQVKLTLRAVNGK
jgi:hypothetical protein